MPARFGQSVPPYRLESDQESFGANTVIVDGESNVLATIDGPAWDRGNHSAYIRQQRANALIFATSPALLDLVLDLALHTRPVDDLAQEARDVLARLEEAI